MGHAFCRAVVIEEALEAHHLVQYFDPELSILGHVNIWQVTGVRSCHRQQPMPVFLRIEVAAGRFEVRRLAFADLMDVEAMVSGWDSGELGVDQDAGGHSDEYHLADLLARGVFNHRGGLLARQGWRGKGERGGQSARRPKFLRSHHRDSQGALTRSSRIIANQPSAGETRTPASSL